MMETYRKEDIRRGDIYYADLRPVVGSEQGGIRPVVILQNNVGNRHSPTVIAAAITSRKGKHKLPTHVNLDAPVPGLYRDSIILLEQLRTIDKSRLRDKLGSLGEDQMCKLDHALEVSVGLLPIYNTVPFPVSWTVKMKKKQKETQDILSYHTQAAGCSDKARAKASGGRQPIEECGRTGL